MTSHNPLIASDRVEGTKVINAEQAEIGNIHSLMIDKQSGRVAFAIMSFGGILGIGQKYYPIPWELLDYEPSMGGYRVDIDEATLEAAPAYSPEDVEALAMTEGTASIDQHYAASIEKRTLADYRGPKIEGDPSSVGISTRPAQTGLKSPETTRAEMQIDQSRGVGVGETPLDIDPIERDRAR
ncbi:hypothetical protein GCM10007973_15700 [Polymorphobacter multimanifer]|uniref:PRC-barrel domain-containing protein n=1 Tax=Polymorphobacter multimanifer TaxID=1070431 RepID=A0A841L6H2_9SPHN|nr:PRC-barrel domain-containing protein [Polymorphobacter multimanifer]MBB6226553.1 hypothetical protein [Polymorphobacter multimanifer]GGI79955.1 hypothetical protein GCM10007973_15700 [Polymorphobacter multimanifer]